MITWKILTTKLFFKHGINMEQNDKMNNLDNKTIVQTWDGIHLVVGLQLLSSCLEPVEKCLKLSLFREKYFWNHHYKKVILRSQLFPTCPKENGHRCLKSGWKQVGGTWSAVAARPTRPPILYISLYVMVSIRYIVCKNIYIYNNILVDPHVRQYTILFHSCREYKVSGIFFQSLLWLLTYLLPIRVAVIIKPQRYILELR